MTAPLTVNVWENQTDGVLGLYTALGHRLRFMDVQIWAYFVWFSQTFTVNVDPTKGVVFVADKIDYNSWTYPY